MIKILSKLELKGKFPLLLKDLFKETNRKKSKPKIFTKANNSEILSFS